MSISHPRRKPKDARHVPAWLSHRKGACGKLAYPDRSTAKTCLKELKSSGKAFTWGDRPLSTYFCDSCNAWHVGHRPSHLPLGG